ncbi:MAG: hypothetical protein JW760_12160 [Spirochaetales bacterium]|nr:hypothetical protein [Spirochaetales bacterium]
MKLEDILAAPTEQRMKRDEYLILPFEETKVQFSVETQQGFLYLLFINELEGRFSTYSAGSYIIKRDLSDGQYIQIKVFYKTDPGSFLRIFPQDDRAKMDVFLQGMELYSGINLPLPFQDYFTEPFESLVQATGNMVDWELLFPRYNPRIFLQFVSFLEVLRERLPLIPDAEDGALDSRGQWVSIETGAEPEIKGLNCSGFAKWIVDGFYEPLKGEYLDIEQLKTRHLEERGNRWSRRREFERDPYFGLDWTRNLAAALYEASTGLPGEYKKYDLTASAFAVYREDVGFVVEDLPLVLYERAVLAPGKFYLGSVNGIFGDDPALRQHYHVAVFFPLLLPDGRVRIYVFERGRETRLEDFTRRYAGESVHLVELEALDNFRPPQLPLLHVE